MSAIAKPEQVKVSDVGTLVRMQFGNTTVEMSYQDALKFSQWVRIHAKRAKNNAGDRSAHWSVRGQLTDAEVNDKKTLREV